MPLPRRVLLLAMLALAGCTMPQPQNNSVLKPTQMSPDSVALEVFSIRVPLGDADANGRLWNEVDEQQLPGPLRQYLAKNGFRAGLVGGQVPEPLAKLLDLKEKSPSSGEPQQVQLDQMREDPRITSRHLQTRAGHRNEVVASAVYDRLPVLISDGGEVRGQTYAQAQGVLALTAFPQADGRVRLELVPEVHYDCPRQHWVGDQAMWRLEAGRPKKAFDDMNIHALMAPGNMLVLTTLPRRPGSLGHYFLTEGEDRHKEQKLVVVRLCQTQHNDLVSPPPLSLAE